MTALAAPPKPLPPKNSTFGGPQLMAPVSQDPSITFCQIVPALISPSGSNTEPSELEKFQSSTSSSNVAVTLPTVLAADDAMPFALLKTCPKSNGSNEELEPFRKSHLSVEGHIFSTGHLMISIISIAKSISSLVKLIISPTSPLKGPKIELISPVILPIISPIIPPRIFSTKHEAALRILSIIDFKISPTSFSKPSRIL